MSIIIRAVFAASVVAAITAGPAQSRDLDSGYHGNTQLILTYRGGPKAGLTQTIRRSYAQAPQVRPRITHAR
jgi:hypothetical protein